MQVLPGSFMPEKGAEGSWDAGGGGAVNEGVRGPLGPSRSPLRRSRFADLSPEPPFLGEKLPGGVCGRRPQISPEGESRAEGPRARPKAVATRATAGSEKRTASAVRSEGLQARF